MGDDAREVAIALSGQREGYRALFQRHRGVVERAIASFAELDELESRDLVLESFSRAFGQLAGLKEPGRFRAFLLATARGRCRSRLARKRDADAIAADLAGAGVLELAPDPGPLAVDLTEQVNALPEGAEREAPRLFYLEGRLTARQIAERLRQSPESVSHHLEQLRARIKERLASQLLSQRAQGAAAPGPEHLDGGTWNHLLRGERLSGEVQLAEHLGRGCPACERFLSGLREADGLDGDVDSLLLGPCERGGAHDHAFEQAMRRLQLHLRVTRRLGPSTGRPQPSKAMPLLLACVLAVAGLFVLVWQSAPRVELRAPPAFPEVGLSFWVVPRGEGRERGAEGMPGQSCSEDQVIFLRYELSSPAFVTLLRVAPQGRAEVLSQQGRLGPGRHDLTVNGRPVGVSLKGFAGKNRFIAVASVAPVTAEGLEILFSAFPETGAQAPALEGAGIAVFEVAVGGN